MSTYLLVNLLSVAIPFIYSFHRRLNFYKTWYAFWPAAIVTAAIFHSLGHLFHPLGSVGIQSPTRARCLLAELTDRRMAVLYLYSLCLCLYLCLPEEAD